MGIITDFKPRYGKFNIRDYIAIVFGIIFFFIVAVSLILFDFSAILYLFPIFFSFIWLIGIILPYFENFKFENSKIIVKKFKTEKEIIIPKDKIIILSYTGLRIFNDIQTTILNGKVSVSIINDNCIEKTLDTLHKDFIKVVYPYIYKRIYTNCDIENDFNVKFVYSFVCDNDLLKNFLNSYPGTVIVPESLADSIPLDEIKNEVIIDLGF